MRSLILLLVALSAACATGCSMCSRGFLDDYATVGGKWQRADQTHGRVGSIFSDPGSTIAAGYTDGNVVYSEQDEQYESFGEAHIESYPSPEFNEFPELNGPPGEVNLPGIYHPEDVIILGDPM